MARKSPSNLVVIAVVTAVTVVALNRAGVLKKA